MLISPFGSLNNSTRIIYLTNINLPCFIDVGAAEKQFAAMLFGNETIAHDKGKPVARQGRKAKSLQTPAKSIEAAQRAGRLSGCRRRSEIVRTLIPRVTSAPATVWSGISFTPFRTCVCRPSRPPIIESRRKPPVTVALSVIVKSYFSVVFFPSCPYTKSLPTKLYRAQAKAGAPPPP
jgi:hypothetical protein